MVKVSGSLFKGDSSGKGNLPLLYMNPFSKGMALKQKTLLPGYANSFLLE